MSERKHVNLTSKEIADAIVDAFWAIFRGESYEARRRLKFEVNLKKYENLDAELRHRCRSEGTPKYYVLSNAPWVGSSERVRPFDTLFWPLAKATDDWTEISGPSAAVTVTPSTTCLEVIKSHFKPFCRTVFAHALAAGSVEKVMLWRVTPSLTWVDSGHTTFKVNVEIICTWEHLPGV